jgi:hypothetical protein
MSAVVTAEGLTKRYGRLLTLDRLDLDVRFSADWSPGSHCSFS